MSRFLFYFYVLLFVSYHTNGEIESNCPKQCECEKSEENGLKVKCEKIKDVRDIIFGNISSEIVAL
jgi:hypothetical protein